MLEGFRNPSNLILQYIIEIQYSCSNLIGLFKVAAVYIHVYTSINLQYSLISHLLDGLYPRGVARSTVGIMHPIPYDLILMQYTKISNSISAEAVFTYCFLPHLFYDERAISPFTCNHIYYPFTVASPLGGSDSSHDECKGYN